MSDEAPMPAEEFMEGAEPSSIFADAAQQLRDEDAAYLDESRIENRESEIQRKLNNAGCLSHLTEAAAEIQRANKCWPFPHAANLVETLDQLKAKIAAELHPSSESHSSHPASPPASDYRSRITQAL